MSNQSTYDTDGTLRREGSNIFLTNLDATAYLHYKGLAIVKALKVSRFKYEFVLYDPDHLGEDLAIEFVNSDCQGFADAVRRLKNVIHKFYGRDDKPQHNRGRDRQGNGEYGKSKPLPIIGRGPGTGRAIAHTR